MLEPKNLAAEVRRRMTDTFPFSIGVRLLTVGGYTHFSFKIICLDNPQAKAATMHKPPNS